MCSGPKTLHYAKFWAQIATKTSAGNIPESLSNLFLCDVCRLLQRLLNNAKKTIKTRKDQSKENPEKIKALRVQRLNHQGPFFLWGLLKVEVEVSSEVDKFQAMFKNFKRDWKFPANFKREFANSKRKFAEFKRTFAVFLKQIATIVCRKRPRRQPSRSGDVFSSKNCQKRIASFGPSGVGGFCRAPKLKVFKPRPCPNKGGLVNFRCSWNEWVY